MNNLTILDEAFEELERRADSYHRRVEKRSAAGAHRTLLVAASVLAVAGVATVVALFVGDGDTASQQNGPELPAGGRPSSATSRAASTTPTTTSTAVIDRTAPNLPAPPARQGSPNPTQTLSAHKGRTAPNLPAPPARPGSPNPTQTLSAHKGRTAPNLPAPPARPGSPNPTQTLSAHK